MSSSKRFPPVPFFQEILPSTESTPIPETSKKLLGLGSISTKSSNVTSGKEKGPENAAEKKIQLLGPLQYLRKRNNTNAANSQTAVLAPLTLTKETVNPLQFKYEVEKRNKQIHPTHWHPLYFQPENEKPKEGRGTKEKVETIVKYETFNKVTSFKSNKTQEDDSKKKMDIVLSSSGSNKRKSSEIDPNNFQLIGDIPSMDVFKTFVFNQYRNTEERCMLFYVC